MAPVAAAAAFADADTDLDSDYEAPLPHPTRSFDNVQVRPVNTEELFDVQQQSDFFLSLGQHEQAIAVLSEHIAANPGTSALAYLDLLRIFHSLDRRHDYARVSAEFEQAFNADVPDFEHFNQAGKGLEHYGTALARIQSQWPAPGTLALIEELVFRAPGANGDEAFDLAAYQELLLLYSVAKEVIDPHGAASKPLGAPPFVDTYLQDEPETAPAALSGREPPAEGSKDFPPQPSIYEGIDDRLLHETVMTAPTGPTTPPEANLPRTERPIDMNVGDFDRTAYETMPTPLEPKPAPSKDPHVIDFELFDPTTEAEIAPKPTKR